MRQFLFSSSSLFVLFAVALLTVKPAASQNSWQQVGGPSGGEVASFAAIDNGDLFAGTYRGGVFRSSNNGTTWTPVNTGLGNLIVNDLALNNLGTLFAATNGGVFRSSDNGDSWESVNTGLTNSFVNAIVANVNDILVGTDGGVHRSRDNGDTWTLTNTGLDPGFGNPVTVRSFAISQIGEIFAGTNDRVYVSRDNGDSWQPRQSGMAANTAVLDILISGNVSFAATGSGVYSSNDGGLFWFESNVGLPLDKRIISALELSSTNQLFAASVLGGVYRSLDFGSNWSPVDASMDAGAHALAIKLTKDVAGNDREDLFAGTYEGVYRANGPERELWTSINDGLTNTEIFSIAANEAGDLFVASNNDRGSGGVYRSTNGGDDWTLMNNGLGSINVVALAITGNGNIFAGTNGSGDGQGVYGSNDNGTSWTNVLGFLDARISVLAVDASDTLWAGTDNAGVWRSGNSGGDWTPLGLQNQGILSIAANLDGDAFAGTYDGVWRLLSGESEWTAISTGLPNDSRVDALAVNGSGNLFAGTEGGLFRSTDNGNSWQPVFAAVRVIAVNDNGDLYAGGDGGAYRSSSDGTSWSSFGTGLAGTSILSMNISSAGEIYVGTLGRGLFSSLTSSTETQDPELELTTRLDQNYPNPFASSTTIQFNLAEPGAVRLEIYDVIGRKVATLVDGSLSAGTHAVSWDGSSVPNGIYFYTLTRAGAHTRAPGAMVVVR